MPSLLTTERCSGNLTRELLPEILELYSSPVVANGLLYIGTSDRYIFCLGGDDAGKIIGNR